MQDLRLVGVHEDGLHLLLSDGDGGRYRVPLDESLRAAARRDRPRLGQLQIEMDGGMRPREVQSLIRSGLSTQEVADRSGWTPEKVRRYEGPILAEREYVAGLAQQVRLRGRAGGSGDTTLAGRVSERLRGRGVDPAVALWDAARNDEGQWTVRLLFPAGGRERTALWWFDVGARSVVPADDEARWLSEDADPKDGPVPHASAVATPTRVYDVEAEGGIDHVRPRRPQSPTDLATAMRESSGARRRRGSSARRTHPTLTPVDDAPREDALPLEQIAFDPQTSPPPPAARGVHPLDAARAEQEQASPEAPVRPVEEEAPVETAETVPADEPVEAEERPDAPTTAERPKPARRGGRPSVPSWDDVMFGPGARRS